MQSWSLQPPWALEGYCFTGSDLDTRSRLLTWAMGGGAQVKGLSKGKKMQASGPSRLKHLTKKLRYCWLRGKEVQKAARGRQFHHPPHCFEVMPWG